MTNTLPFAHLRVLELASVLAGPQVGQFFAELGAEVLKVESPAGDVTRTWRTTAETAASVAGEASVSAYFSASNWGKKSMVLDLTTAAGQAALRRLAATADVVVASYKPGDAEKLGADYASLAAENPGLIYGHLTGYGPHEGRPVTTPCCRPKRASCTSTLADRASRRKKCRWPWWICWPRISSKKGCLRPCCSAKEPGAGPWYTSACLTVPYRPWPTRPRHTS
jgi:hypothetical protein